MFCRSRSPVSFPKDPDFSPLVAKEDASTTNIIGLHHDEKRETDQDMLFCGGQRVCVGFMQSVIEIFTAPRDVVLDWSISGGATFAARDNSNRFVVGFENRKLFLPFAKELFLTVKSRKAPVISLSSWKAGLSKPKLGFAALDSDEMAAKRLASLRKNSEEVSE